VAIAGNLVLMATLDAHLIAFDRRTGEIAWDSEIIDYTTFLGQCTVGGGEVAF